MTELSDHLAGSDFPDDTFKAGQIWRYTTRPGEEDSTLSILKVESYDHAGMVVHLRVNGLSLRNRHHPDGVTDEIGHLPLSKEALLKSVTTLVSENNPLPDFRSGYGNWKEAFDSKRAGVFSLTMSDAVQYVEEALNTAR